MWFWQGALLLLLQHLEASLGSPVGRAAVLLVARGSTELVVLHERTLVPEELHGLVVTVGAFLQPGRAARAGVTGVLSLPRACVSFMTRNSRSPSLLAWFVMIGLLYPPNFLHER